MTEDRIDLAATLSVVRQASVGWHIQRLAAQLDNAMNRALEPYGLTIQQFAIVMTLVENDGLTQTEVGSFFRAPAYAITRAIDALENDGFLERRSHPTSRRTNTVHATEKSLALVPELIGLIENVNARLMARLDNGDRRALRDTLSQILGDNEL